MHKSFASTQAFDKSKNEPKEIASVSVPEVLHRKTVLSLNW